MITTRKYAVRFPGLDNLDTKNSINVFSEGRIITAEKTFFSVIDAASSIAELVVQKNRTKELGVRLSAQKEALDAEIKNKKEQLKIKYIEEAQRLKIQLATEKEEMDIEFRRMKIELAEKSRNFDFTFEECVRTNRIFYDIIVMQKKRLEKIQPFIKSLADDYSNRREYIKYCELERKSLNLIEQYLTLMI